MDAQSQSEMKQAIADLTKAVEESRKVYDAKLEAVAKQRGASEFDEKLDKLLEAQAAQDKAYKAAARRAEEEEAKRRAAELEWKAQQEEYARKQEARLNRLALGLGGAEVDTGADERLSRKSYDRFLRKGVEQLSMDERKVLVVSNDTTGGYLAPASYVADIIKAEVLYSPMRTLVTVRQVGTGEMQQPKRTGTAKATRPGNETATKVESQNPAWGLLKLSSPEMYAEARISNANLEDSAFDLEALLRDEFAEQFGVLEGSEVISGNGVNACLGFLDANAAGPGVPIAYTPSGSAATIAGAAGAMADGLVTLFHAVKTAYAARGTWALNRGSLGKVRLLKDTTGNYLWAPQPGIGGSIPYASPGTILGAPYTECPDMPDEGANTFPIAYGDWKRAYTMVERLDLVITRDPYTLASVGQVKFFARRRVGGQVVLGEAIRLLKCATS